MDELVHLNRSSAALCERAETHVIHRAHSVESGAPQPDARVGYLVTVQRDALNHGLDDAPRCPRLGSW